jgi:RNA polymerase sigma-70 factor (ECF subfamily)
MTDLENKSKDLYKDFLEGNKEAFNEIMRLYRIPLINFITGYVHNVEVAEDLAQDTFLYILIKKDEYDFKYTLKTYLYTIAKCRTINYLKRQRKSTEFKEYYIYEIQDIDFDENIVKEEKNKEVQKALHKLKPQYRTAIYLKDFENFEYKEICKILNINMYQTKMLIYRARKSLKKHLEKEGYKYDE